MNSSMSFDGDKTPLLDDSDDSNDEAPPGEGNAHGSGSAAPGAVSNDDGAVNTGLTTGELFSFMKELAMQSRER